MADRNIPSNSDAAYGSVVTHLHFNGVDGSTTFTDQKGKTYTANGDAKLSSTSPKFGSASMLCDGAGDYIRTATGLADFQFGTGDFTVEAWVKTTANNKVLFDYYLTTDTGCWELYVNSSGNLEWYSSTASGAVLIVGASGGPVNTGNWVHVAASRVGTTLRLFVDGVQKGSGTDTRNYNASLAGFAIGAQVNSRNGTYDWNGNIDEVRITKGVGRYSGSFTPPSTAFDDTVVTLPQVLADVSQTASGTVTAGADRSFAAAQALAGVSQTAGASVRPAVSATQTLGGVSQASTAKTTVSASASQTLHSVAQVATATATEQVSASQTLADVTQAATAIVTSIASLSAAQTLDAVSQQAAGAVRVSGGAAQALSGVTSTATGSIAVDVSATQALAGVDSSAAGSVVVAAQGSQALDGVSQAATATVAETVRAFIAAQILAAVSQNARLRHRYVFERNERTVDVRAESRAFAVAAEDRSFEVVPESRGVAIAGEDRRIAFTD